MQPASIAVTLRRRTPWEATDLGLAMLQRWWRPVFAAHALVFVPLALAFIAIGWALEALWVAVLLVWWFEPVYDRVVLHVLSRAVFGEVPAPRSVLRSFREWAVGLVSALTRDGFDLARSFNLPVRQLEGQRGREARARRSVLGRRARGHAVGLTVVWLHFEAALLWSAGALSDLLLPAQLERARGADDSFFGGLAEALQSTSLADAFIYAGVIFVLEPFYVAAGFALYLNRRTLLEGWDIEVALRRIAERHAAAALILIMVIVGVLAVPGASHAQEKNPKREITEVLKAPEFGHYRETLRWQARDPAKPREAKSVDLSAWHGIGYAIAKAAEVLLWGLAIAAALYALWWISQRLPRGLGGPREAYRPPAALFGMELAPEKLPPDVASASMALAREGRLRDALSLLYRGALSELVHKRGVELLASHTEGEAVQLAGMPYFGALVEVWRSCAYARRDPSLVQVERLAFEYQAAFP